MKDENNNIILDADNVLVTPDRGYSSSDKVPPPMVSITQIGETVRQAMEEVVPAYLDSHIEVIRDRVKLCADTYMNKRFNNVFMWTKRSLIAVSVGLNIVIVGSAIVSVIKGS